MAVSVAKAGPYYSSGQISFSSLRSNFRAQSKRESSGGSESFATDTAQIKASQLLRITSTTNTDPTVPNATENANITTTKSNWRASDFRNSIKFYYIILPSSDNVINFDIDAQSWNSNLNKNIIKVAFIDGICGSNSTSSPAAEFDATAYNLRLDVYGEIYGAGGAGGTLLGVNGGGGGDALRVVSSNGNNVVVNVRSGAKIYGGGGGGARGFSGDDGTAATCKKSEYFQQACQQGSFISCPSGWNQTSSGQNCCEWKRGCNANNWWRWCEQTISTTTPAGGLGGNGGPGRGYNNYSPAADLSGAAGGSSNCPSCPGGYSQSGGSCSSDGQDGGDGGEWGQDGEDKTKGTNTRNGGNAGAAIVGSNYSTSGTIDSSTVIGSYNP